MNKKNVRNIYISVSICTLAAEILSPLVIDSAYYIGFLPMVIMSTFFLLLPRYFLFTKILKDDMFVLHERIAQFIDHYRLRNIRKVFIEEFKFNSVVGLFVGIISLFTLFDSDSQDSASSIALRENLPLTITITLLFAFLLLGIIHPLISWVISVLMKFQVAEEEKIGKQFMKELEKPKATLTGEPFDGSHSGIIDDIEKHLKMGLSNSMVTTELIPFLVKQCYQTEGAERALSIMALRILVEHGYWKAVYKKERLDIIKDGYRNETFEVRNQTDALLYELIRHETIDEILEVGLLDIAIETIRKWPEFYENGLFQFSLHGQSEKIIPELLHLLEDEDPLIRRKVMAFLGEITLTKEDIDDERKYLQKKRKLLENNMDTDYNLPFYLVPSDNFNTLTIEEIKRRMDRLKSIDPDPIIKVLAQKCAVEENSAVRENAYFAILVIALNLERDTLIKSLFERYQIKELCIKALSDQNILIRCKAIQTLSYFDDSSIIPKITPFTNDHTIVPLPTPLTPEEEEELKESDPDQKTICEVAKTAIDRLQK